MNGGGVYVSTPPYNIRIEKGSLPGNTAEIMGGGIWSCPTGTVSLGTTAPYSATPQSRRAMTHFVQARNGYSSSLLRQTASAERWSPGTATTR